MIYIIGYIAAFLLEKLSYQTKHIEKYHLYLVFDCETQLDFFFASQHIQQANDGLLCTMYTA